MIRDAPSGAPAPCFLLAIMSSTVIGRRRRRCHRLRLHPISASEPHRVAVALLQIMHPRPGGSCNNKQALLSPSQCRYRPSRRARSLRSPSFSIPSFPFLIFSSPIIRLNPESGAAASPNKSLTPNRITAGCYPQVGRDIHVNVKCTAEATMD